MDLIIIDAIRIIKEKKKRPSVENIYEYAKKQNDDLNDDEFIKDFKDLESKKVIINTKPNEIYGSYQLCTETLAISFFEQQQRVMKIETSNKEEIIKLLKDQLDTLKTELKQKDDIIQNLISLKRKDIEFENENKLNNIVITESSDNDSVLVSMPTLLPPGDVENSSVLGNFELKDKEQEREIMKNNIDEQLTKVRTEKHQKYMQDKNLTQPINNANAEELNGKEQEVEEQVEVKINKGQWKDNMVLIAGDSTICGLMEKRMGNNVKVRSFPGARIHDMYYYLTPLIAKRPKYIILHVSTNDAADKSSSDEILNELLQLKQFIEKSLPDSTLFISYPLIRNDRIGPRRTIFDLREKLNMLNINCIMHENLTEEHLGKGGLHLNAKGLGRLATNYISFIRHL